VGDLLFLKEKNNMENGEAPNTERPKKKRSPKTTARIIERGSRILKLRAQGKSLRKISAMLIKEAKDAGLQTRGFSYEQVRLDFREIVELRIDEQQSDLEEVRIITAERLEKVIREFTPLLETEIGGLTADNLVRAKLKAGDVIIKAAKEYAELFGAKRPQRLELTGEGGKPLNLITQVVVEFTDTPNEKE
jgi:hypothetical protein